MILHIPHSSTYIPEQFKSSFVKPIINDLLRMTDWFTQDLFFHKDSERIVFNYSRLICDVERFVENEPMEKKGHGICYTNDSYGDTLREVSDYDREYIIENLYKNHHHKLSVICNSQLVLNKFAVLVDCHSFSNTPLPHESYQDDRPDFCIGTDDFHTPPELINIVNTYLSLFGFEVKINNPFAGTMVPLPLYNKNKNFNSILIEVNRSLYMHTKNYDFIKEVISGLLNLINIYELSKRHEYEINGYL